MLQHVLRVGKARWVDHGDDLGEKNADALLMSIYVGGDREFFREQFPPANFTDMLCADET